MPEMHMRLPKAGLSEDVPGGSFQNTGKYSYCGPFTKLNKRLTEGYRGVNQLDRACFDHDVAYAAHKDIVLWVAIPTFSPVSNFRVSF